MKTLLYENSNNLAIESGCCDGIEVVEGISQCGACDNFFVYCIRNHNDRRVGCPGPAEVFTSQVNIDSTPIDFNQSMVLGLPNPLLLGGFNPAFEVNL